MSEDVLRTPTPVSVADLLGPFNKVEAHFVPRELFACGNTSLIREGVRVAVVGTRNPSEAGRKRTARVARILATNGVTVVSGLARGVDAIAHRAAIGAGGRTVAVLGNGLDRYYPPENSDLQREIMRDHLAISQFPLGSAPERTHFPIRNRLMALASHATVITEAGASSGTQSQAWEALRLGRPLFVLKSLAERESITWIQEVLKYGAIVLAEESDLLDCLPLETDLGAAAAF